MASLGLLAAAVGYLAWKSVFAGPGELDFRYLWTAGRLWKAGADPYSSAFPTTGRQLFPTGNVIYYWVYPPQWWLVCRPLAALGVDQALWVWRALSAAALMAGGMLVVAALKPADRPLPPWGAAFFLASLPLSEATPQTLALGQTSILIFFGFCLLTHGLLTDRAVTMTLALILLWMKPQFGAAVTLPLLFLPRWSRAIAAAAAVSLLAALPQLAAHGIGPTLTGLLGNITEYGRIDFNLPQRMTGLTQILAQRTALHLPMAVAVGLAALTATGATLALRRHANTSIGRAALALGFVAAPMFFLPLHSYDLVTLPIAAALVLPFSRPARAAVWAGVLIAFRPTTVTLWLLDKTAVELGLLTLATALILSGAGLAVWETARRQQPD